MSIVFSILIFVFIYNDIRKLVSYGNTVVTNNVIPNNLIADSHKYEIGDSIRLGVLVSNGSSIYNYLQDPTYFSIYIAQNKVHRNSDGTMTVNVTYIPTVN